MDGKLRRRRLIYTSLALGFSVALLSCNRHWIPATNYYIPDGYVGYVVIEYGIKGAPTLPMEEGRYVVRVSEIGYAKTSSRFVGGLSWPDQYFYVSKQGLKRIPFAGDNSLIQGESNGVCGKIGEWHDQYQWFFVGTVEQLKRQGIVDSCKFIQSARRVR